MHPLDWPSMQPARTVLIVAVILASAFVPAAAVFAEQPGTGLDDDTPAAAAPPAQRVPAGDPTKVKAAVDKLLGDYRNPKSDPAARQKAVHDILDLGPDGARLLVPELAKDLGTRRKTYLAHFD